MTGILRPVGPKPAQVYWVRRAVVLAMLVLVAVLVTLGVGALAGTAAADGAGTAPDAQEADATDAGGTEAQAASGEDADAATEPVGPVACDAASLTVTLTAEGRSFAAPTAPTFALAVTNAGDVPCTVDAGSGNQVVTVTSGADRIWSSLDCAGASEERLLLLQPGAQDVVPVPWDRTRSDEACSSGLPAPGAGTYQAVGSMLGAQSAPFVFDLG